ncbi:MAG: aldo/keto reductase [Clostridiales bacterium]|nr:aldo/keto reductase [Clostridiales bacterium]
MVYSTLGRTGIKVSRVGFGGIPIQQLNQNNVDAIIDKCLEMGINFFDTARGYTVSEGLLGNSFYGRRKDIYIATKSGVRDRDSMLRDVEISLKELRTDYIDLYQLHNVGSPEELNRTLRDDGAYKALRQLKDEGVVKHIGITSHKEEVIEKALETDMFETIQFPLNVVERQGEYLFERAYEKNVGTIAMKPIAGGAIRDAQGALKFILDNPHLTVAIPGMDSVEQVIQNSQAANMPLTKEEKESLEKEARELGQTFCRRCGYCLPCPEGIDIPMMFLMEGYYTRYDLKDWARERYATQDKNASHCAKCGNCEELCPYELPIMDMLDKVDAIFGS